MRLALTGSNGSPPILAEDDWKLTDSELVARLLDYPATEKLMDALLRGDLYGLLGLFWIEPDGDTAMQLQPSGIQALRSALADRVGLAPADLPVYVIRDKRARKIDNLRIRTHLSGADKGVQSFGHAPRRYLFGACSGIQSTVTSEATARCYDSLREIFGSNAVVPCDPVESLMRAFGTAQNVQPTLF